MKNRFDKPLSRRDFLKLSLAAAALAALRPLPDGVLQSLEKGYRENLGGQVTSSDTKQSHYSPLTLLAANRLTFGPKKADLDWIEENGVDAFVDEQLAFDKIDDSALAGRLASLTTLNQSATAAPPVGADTLLQLQTSAILHAVYSHRQLYELMVDFWTNHFNISFGNPTEYILKTIDDRDVVRPNAMGKFRDLLGASAHSPAMLISLNNNLSVKKNPNENYARELMEQHTIGANGGFSQKDVTEVARSFTGWTVNQLAYKQPIVGTFEFSFITHDEDSKVVLGHRLTGAGEEKDGERVLDILASTPACATYISSRLAQRFVSDNPPDSVIQAGSDAFLSTQGDITATLSAILHSPEFKSSVGLKVKRPLDYVASALRVLDAQTDGGLDLQGFLLRMGQPLFLRPFPDGYPDTSQDWVNSGSMLARWNFAKSLVNNNIKGTTVNLKGMVSQSDSAIDDLSQVILFGPVSAELADALGALVDPKKLPELAALLVASPMFQMRG